MRCFASATALSFSGAMVERVDRDTMGKSARLAYMPVHQLDHCQRHGGVSRENSGSSSAGADLPPVVESLDFLAQMNLVSSMLSQSRWAT